MDAGRTRLQPVFLFTLIQVNLLGRTDTRFPHDQMKVSFKGGMKSGSSPRRLRVHCGATPAVRWWTANGRNRERRETGKEQMVQVHYGEGVAIHIGPESCAGGREAVREALTGECAGQPLSREKVDIPGADAVRYAEGHTKGRAIASSPTTRRGRRPWHVQTLFVREPGGLVVDQGGTPPLVRIGKARSRSR
jgi:hypothetical protein